MMSLNKIFIIFCFINLIISKTEYLIVLARHGARNPQRQFKGFPITYTNSGLSDLNMTGMRQHFNLGRMLRKNYSDLIPNSMSYYMVKFTVSNEKRTISSALSQLQGMYFNGLPININTPDTPANWKAPFNVKETKTSSEIGIDALTSNINLLGISSFTKNLNFMFEAHKDCKNVKDDYTKSYQDFENKYKNKFQPSFDLFDERNVGVKAMNGDSDLSWSFYNLSDIADFLNAWMFSYEDPTKISRIIDYKLKAHIMMINAISIYSDFAQHKSIHIFNKKLLDSWKSDLKDFKENFYKNEQYYNKASIYVGHEENLAAIILQLIKPDLKKSFLNLYLQFLKMPLENKNDYTEFLKFFKSPENLLDITFASNLLIEINSHSGNTFN